MVVQQPGPRVVVGVDGAKDGLLALAWAMQYAADRDGSVHVVYVVDTTRPQAPADRVALYVDAEVLDEAAGEFDRLGYTCLDRTFDLRHGAPAEVLLEIARASGLLVIGRRGRGGFAELIVGSVSQKCAALGASVVIVPDHWSPDRKADRVVVGLDGSEYCQQALDFGFDAAARLGCQLRAVHAIDVPPSVPRTDLWSDPDGPPEWADDADRLLTETLAGWQQKYPNVPVEAAAIPGHPVEVLCTESHDADLIVVGGLGRTRFTQLRMGSVSRGLLHHTTCPVAIIHQQQR